MTTVMDDIQAREARHVLQTYRRQPVTFVRGEGVRLYDAEGREYLDLLSGIGVASLGHAHPRAGARDRRAGADADPHVEPVLPPAAGAARRAAREPVGPAARVLLQQRHRGGRGVPEVRAPLLVHAAASRAPEFIALDESFHGRTFGSLSVTSDEHYRAPFEPLLPGVTFVPANDPAALAGGGLVERRRRSSPSRCRAKAASGR